MRLLESTFVLCCTDILHALMLMVACTAHCALRTVRLRVARLQALCEHAYVTAGNQSVHLMAVSYGPQASDTAYRSINLP